jgi:division protein CdvB (Snf7/Vps24/ESCRT-III family)
MTKSIDLTTATERQMLVHIIHRLKIMEDHMSNLDDAVSGIADAITTEVNDLRAKLQAAEANDAAAAELAADVETNVAKLESIASGLRDGSFPAADVPPAG